MSEQNKALVRRVIEEVWNQGNFAVAEELIASSYIGHSSSVETHGPAGYKEFFASLRGAFPDIRVSIEDQIGELDRVATRWTARGTHMGDFQGIPPTHKQGSVTGISIFRIVNDEVVECWTLTDDLSLLQQLGVLPVSAKAA